VGRNGVIVIGGGIIGCTAAALLAEAGRDVTLVEATSIAAGASGRNSGSIQHPFDPVLLPPHRASLAMYRELAATDDAFSLPVDPVGVLLLTDNLAEATSRAAELQADVPELEPTVLDPSAVAGLEPALSPGWAAVRLNTGYPVTPDAATLAMAARAARAGATVRIGVAARPWITDGQVRGAALEDGSTISGAAVLVAGGPWTPEILDMAPPWPPITRTWGVTVQVAISDPPHHILEEGVVHTVNVPTGQAGSLFSLMPVGAVATVGSTFLADPPDPEVEGRLLVARGAAFVPALANAPILGIRMCARPQSSDGRPRIGPVPGAEGLFVCAGHGPWGISTGPGSAALIADLILGREARIPAELAASR
jgi:glycine/D-amino acid oxidase-like deaminating enzyme